MSKVFRIAKTSSLGQAGATYVEMAISIGVFMFIMISIIELMRFSYINITLQHVVNESIRNAVVADFTEIEPGDENLCTTKEFGYIQGFLQDQITRGLCTTIDVSRKLRRFGLTGLNPGISAAGINENGGIIVKARSIETFEQGPARENDLCELDPGQQQPLGGNPGDYLSICVRYQVRLFSFFDIFEIRAFAIARNESFKFEQI